MGRRLGSATADAQGSFELGQGRGLLRRTAAKLLALASHDKTVKLWDAGSGAVLQTLEGHSNSVNAVAFSPDGKLLASASADKTVKLWDAGSGALQQTLKGHSDSVEAVAFSPDGKLLASASDDKTVKLLGRRLRSATADAQGSFELR